MMPETLNFSASLPRIPPELPSQIKSPHKPNIDDVIPGEKKPEQTPPEDPIPVQQPPTRPDPNYPPPGDPPTDNPVVDEPTTNPPITEMMLHISGDIYC